MEYEKFIYFFVPSVHLLSSYLQNHVPSPSDESEETSFRATFR